LPVIKRLTVAIVLSHNCPNGWWQHVFVHPLTKSMGCDISLLSRGISVKLAKCPSSEWAELKRLPPAFGVKVKVAVLGIHLLHLSLRPFGTRVSCAYSE